MAKERLRTVDKAGFGATALAALSLAFPANADKQIVPDGERYALLDTETSTGTEAIFNQIQVSREQVEKAADILASVGGFTAVVAGDPKRGDAVVFTIEPNEKVGTLTVGKNLSGKLDRQTFFGLLIRDRETGLYSLNMDQNLSSNPVAAMFERAGINDDEIANQVDNEGFQLGSRGEEYKPFGLVEFTDVGFSCNNVRREDGEKLQPFLERKMACSTENRKNREIVAKNYEGVLNEQLASLAHAKGVQNEAATRQNEAAIRQNEAATRQNEAAIRQNEADIAAAKKAIEFHERVISEALKLMNQ